jgi:hypothetical protein
MEAIVVRMVWVVQVVQEAVVFLVAQAQQVRDTQEVMVQVLIMPQAVVVLARLEETLKMVHSTRETEGRV